MISWYGDSMVAHYSYCRAGAPSANDYNTFLTSSGTSSAHWFFLLMIMVMMWLLSRRVDTLC